MAHALKTNILEFSAFKEASFRNSLVELITDTGKLPTWSEFRKQALATSQLYNVNWLQTEFNQTVATANMAGKWQEFQETKDLYPNLKYVTVGDKRVRDKHEKWDGFIAPIDHPIWKKLLPPNDWGCRCDVIPTDEAPTKGYETFKAPIKAEFANNGAISGKIFKQSAYEQNLDNSLKKQAKNNITTFLKNRKLNRYNKINFTKVKDIKNNGIFELFTNGKQNKKEFPKNKRALKILADTGDQYRLLPVIDDGNKNPDAYNLKEKIFADIKASDGINGKNIIQSGLKEASKQGAEELIIYLNQKPDSYRKMYQALRNSILSNRNSNVKFLKIIFPNNSVKTYNINKIASKIKKTKAR